MIAARFAVPVLAILGLSLVPVVRHQYIGALEDDGRSTARLPMAFAGLAPAFVGERPAWVSEAFDSDDWVERRLRANGREVVLFVVRSYDAKRLYHHPELAIVHGHDLRPSGLHFTDTTPPIPLQTLRGEHTGVAVYTLLHRDTFVDDPYRFQARIAGRMLFARREPMTLVFAHDLAAPLDDRIESSPAARVVVDAAHAFLAQKPEFSPRP